MANPFQSGDPADDPLAAFASEADGVPAATSEAARKKSKPVNPPLQAVFPPRSQATEDEPDFSDDAEIRPSQFQEIGSRALEPVRRTSDVSVEVVGPPPPAGAVSFDQVCSVKGLGFVEGVALIQAACDAVRAVEPVAGVPELDGLFLTATGEVVPHGPPTGEPPAQELARLLHQLVAPKLMPPAGRLFVGRWINNDASGLTEFASELAYFARPNGRELLVAQHVRCIGELVRRPVQPRVRKTRERTPPEQLAQTESPRDRSSSLVLWARNHKPEVTAAVVIVAAAVATGLVTWIWQSSALAASKPRPPVSSVAKERTPASDEAVVPPTAPLGVGNSNVKTTNTRPPVPTLPSNRTSSAPPIARRGPSAGQSNLASIQSQDVARGVPPAVPPPVLAAATLPDLRIYSASDDGVEPPRMRSAELLEVLITGFDKRTNQVELIISERGEVQQARMIGPPQRMPDIMLLSRAKELQFDPAVKNGVPVRYRLKISWNVTP
jgi:hypothetical protein